MADHLGQRLGNYRLIRLLGRGGFAEVYLGEHLHLGTQAAVKVLYTRLASKDDVEGFEKEARTVAHLRHPHIVRVLDYDVEDDTPFLIMDYAAGGSLRNRYPKGMILPLTTIISIVKQIADALQYAHDQRITHRDVKPENMLIGEHEELMLADFGIAIVAQSSHYQSTYNIGGTIAYMAPEQIQGKPRATSDQYSLGIVVYEWLSGDRPFHGSLTELVGQHLSVPPPSLHEKVATISPVIEQVVLKALAKDPRERFTSIRAFATALEQAFQATVHPSIVLTSETPELNQLMAPIHTILANQPTQRAQSTDVTPTSSQTLQAANLVTPPGRPSHSPIAGTTSSSAKEFSAIHLLEKAISASNVSKHKKTASASKLRSDTKVGGHQRVLSIKRSLFLFGLVLLIVVGSIGFLSLRIVSNRATDNARVIATAQRNMANASTKRASTVQANIDVTGTVQANNTLTATVAESQNIYKQVTGRTPILQDPLSDNSKGYNWEEWSACFFTGGAYHIKTLIKEGYICRASRTDFSNFAYQVKATIIQGDCAGIVFRSGDANGQFYLFSVCRDGTYYLDLNDSNSSTQTRILANGTDSAMNGDLNQPNFITVFATGSAIDFYINEQHLIKVIDSTYSHGQIGLVADVEHNLTEVIFNDVKVWQL